MPKRYSLLTSALDNRHGEEVDYTLGHGIPRKSQILSQIVPVYREEQFLAKVKLFETWKETIMMKCRKKALMNVAEQRQNESVST